MKKILSLIIVASMLLSLCAFADSTEEFYDKKMTDAQQKGLLEALDIPVYSEKVNATRSEFAVALADLFKLEGAAEGTSLPFEDVSKESEYYNAVSALYNVNAVAASTSFNPSANIRRAEATKMVVSILGYNVVAMAKGGYPTGYFAVAREFNLNNLVKGGEFITKEELNGILYEILFAPTNEMKAIEISGNSVSNIEYKEGDSVLKVYYDTNTVIGVLDGNEITSITDGKKTNEGYITVNGNMYKLSSKMREKSYHFDYIGIRSEVYVRNFEGSKEVIYLRPYESKSVIIPADDIENYSDFKLTTYEDNKTVTYDLKKSFSVIYNGKLYKDFKNSDFNVKEGYIELFENEENKGYDLVKIVEKEYLVKQNFDLRGYLSDINGNTDAQVNFGDNDNIIKCFYYESNGNKVLCDKSALTSFTTFEVTKSKKVAGEGQYITVTGFANEVEGKISAVYDDAVTINGVDYGITPYFTKYYAKADLSNNSTIYLTSDNKVIGFVKSSVAMRYAFFIKLAKEKGYEGERKLYVMDYSGQKNAYYFAKNVIVDGKSVKVDFDNVNNDLTKKLSKDYQLLRYKLNDDGKVELIDTVGNTTPVRGKDMYVNTGKDERDSLTLNYQGSLSKQEISSAITFPPILVPRTTKIFCVPTALLNSPSTYVFNKDDFYAADVNEMAEKALTNSYIYDSKSNGDAGAWVVYLDGSATDIPQLTTQRKGRYIVEKIVMGVSEDGLPTRKLTLSTYEEEVFSVLYFSDKLNEEFDKHPEWKINKGDLVNITRFGNTITNLMVEVKYSATPDKVTLTLNDKNESPNANYIPSTKYTGAYTSGYHMSIGTLYCVEENVLTMYDELTDSMVSTYIQIYGSQIIPRYNKTTRSVELMDIAKLKGAKDSSWEEADKIIIATYIGFPFQFFAYEQ